MGTGDEMINFGDKEVKGQGHTTPKSDSEVSFSTRSVEYR